MMRLSASNADNCIYSTLKVLHFCNNNRIIILCERVKNLLPRSWHPPHRSKEHAWVQTT
jgi:hypothetical protein